MTSDDGQRLGQLEQALLDQAETLARERVRNAETASRRLAAEATERLSRAEAREREAVRAEADKRLRRRVQAAEGQLTAELDRLRWALTEAALSTVRLALVDLTRDRDAYLAVLEGFLAAAARALPPGDLVAEANGHDCAWLGPLWPALSGRAAPGRRVELACHGRDSLGGLCLSLSDRRARVDHTFEARQERLAEVLAGAVMARMFAGPPELGGR